MSNLPDAAFWDSRYKTGQTPWNFGGVPADLKEYLKRYPKGGRVLIPGCGWGYEIQAFADAGYDVTAIDFSPAAVERARKLVNPELAQRILVADFFKHNFGNTPFDVVYERTFLCSLVPEQRAAYRDRMTRLLKYSGALIGYFYYQNTDPKDGPPFGLAWGEADELFARHFLLMKDIPVNDSLPIFATRERWQERRRTSYPGAPTPV
jgi:SAM-dependent methyltransferase